MVLYEAHLYACNPKDRNSRSLVPFVRVSASCVASDDKDKQTHKKERRHGPARRQQQPSHFAQKGEQIEEKYIQSRSRLTSRPYKKCFFSPCHHSGEGNRLLLLNRPYRHLRWALLLILRRLLLLQWSLPLLPRPPESDAREVRHRPARVPTLPT